MQIDHYKEIFYRNDYIVNIDMLEKDILNIIIK